MAEIELPKGDALLRIYTWASQNTSEKRLSTSDFKYHWPEAASRLLFALELSQGSLMTLVGLSGVGKSSAMNQIMKKLKEKNPEIKAVYFKWPGYFDANFEYILKFLKEQGMATKSQELIPEIIERAIRKRDTRLLKNHARELLPEKWDEFKDLSLGEFQSYLTRNLSGYDAETLAEKLLGPTEEKTWNKELTISLLSQCHSILLDLRDYGMKDARAMNTDIDEIQNLWIAINERTKASSSPNIIFVLQKELAFSSDARVSHYFLGKVRFFEITPFSPDDLIDAYEEEFGSLYPFERNDLTYIARMSRGVFRRFLKYIQLCLDRHIEAKSGELVSSETVQKALTMEEMSKDWELELRQIFPRGSYWSHALRILRVLVTEPSGLSQSSLCEFIQVPSAKGNLVNIDPMELSRIVRKLEDYGYVRRVQLGGKNMVYANM